MEKTCTKCGETKPLTEFHKDTGKQDGHTGHCKVCTRARTIAWNRANPNRNRARAAAWNRANPDRNHARAAEWARINPIYKWRDAYLVRCRKYGLIPVVEPLTREDVVKQYGNTCFYCDNGAFEELDHHIPVAAGGHHTLANVRPTCHACNQRKNNAADRKAIKAFRRHR